MFSPEDVEYLRTLPAVVRVTEKRITYSDAFKNACVRRYLAGESPVKLFREAGLDPAVIGYKRIERCFARWREYALNGDNPSTMWNSENNRGGGVLLSPSNSGVADSPTDKASETAGRPDGVKTEPRAIVFHPRKNEQVDMRDLMIYQQVRRISELQLGLKQREGQQGRADRSSRATQANQSSQSDQTDLTDQNGPSDQSEPSDRPVLVD